MGKKLKAAILDDDEIFAEILKSKIERMASMNGLDFCITFFNSISELEAGMAACDILFLDIELQERNGIEWVQKWQESGKFQNIIFVSAYSEYVFQSFESRPIAFVRKTYLEEDLNRALALYKRKCSELAEFVSIPEGKKIQIFKVADILYLKGSGHYVEFHKADGEIKLLRGKMNAMEEILGQRGFVRVKISCLLNVKYIIGIYKKQILLKNGEKFKISSKYQEQSFEKLKIFLTGSGK